MGVSQESRKETCIWQHLVGFYEGFHVTNFGGDFFFLIVGYLFMGLGVVEAACDWEVFYFLSLIFVFFYSLIVICFDEGPFSNTITIFNDRSSTLGHSFSRIHSRTRLHSRSVILTHSLTHLFIHLFFHSFHSVTTRTRTHAGTYTNIKANTNTRKHT